MFKKYDKTLIEELGTNPELNGEFFAQEIMTITGRSKAQVSLVCCTLDLPFRMVKEKSRYQKLYDLEVFQTTYQAEKGEVDG